MDDAGPRARIVPFVVPSGGGLVLYQEGRTGAILLLAIPLLLGLLSVPALSASSPFGPNIRVDDDPGFEEQKFVAVAADPSGTVYAVWQDRRHGDPDIYFSLSADGGRTFGPSKAIDGNPPEGTSQEKPAIAYGCRGELVVVWQDDRLRYMDYDIFGTISTDRGVTFGPVVRIDDGEKGTIQRTPSVAVDCSGTVYVAWQDDRGGSKHLRLARGSANPFSFEPSMRIDDLGGPAEQAMPAVAVGPLGTVYVAYHDNRTGDANVYLARSTDGGRRFGGSVRIDDTGAATSVQGLVSLAVDSLETLYAVWQDSRGGDFDIYFAKSTDGGRTFSPNVRVDDGPRGTNQLSPGIWVGAAGTLYVVWHDERNLDTDIYFTYSTDGGRSFQSSVRIDDAPDSPSDPNPQYHPQVVESNTGLVTVLWQDGRRDISGDIYAATAYFPLGSALRVEVSLRPLWIAPREWTNITVRVTSNGTGVDGALISLRANATGSFGAVTALGSGYYATTYSPNFSMSPSGGTVRVTIQASASKPGYLSGVGLTALTVSPRILVAVQAPWDTLAVGQSMDLVATATALGVPVSNASVSAISSVGGGLTATGGWTDASGRWKTAFRAPTSAGGTTVTVTIDVQKEGFIPGSAVFGIVVLAEPRPLEMQLASNRWEMMSYETATLAVRLTSGGAGVTRALVTAYARVGNLSPVQEVGNGTYAFTYDAPKVTGPTWVLLYVYAKAGGYSDARGSLSFLVDPNMTNPSLPTQLYLYAYAEGTSVSSGSSLLVTVAVYTGEGYAVSGATLSVAVSRGLGSVSRVADWLNGFYTFLYTAASVPGETYVTLKIGASKYGYASGTVRMTLLISL